MNLMKKIQTIRNELLKRDIKKSGKNNFGNFNYYELSDILPHIMELEIGEGLISLFNMGDNKATLTLMDIEDSESYCFTMDYPDFFKMDRMNLIQSTGSFVTYLRRYLYVTAYNIIENDIIDSLQDGGQAKELKSKPSKAPKQKKVSKNLNENEDKEWSPEDWIHQQIIYQKEHKNLKPRLTIITDLNKLLRNKEISKAQKEEAMKVLNKECPK